VNFGNFNLLNRWFCGRQSPPRTHTWRSGEGERWFWRISFCDQSEKSISDTFSGQEVQYIAVDSEKTYSIFHFFVEQCTLTGILKPKKPLCGAWGRSYTFSKNSHKLRSGERGQIYSEHLCDCGQLAVGEQNITILCWQCFLLHIGSRHLGPTMCVWWTFVIWSRDIREGVGVGRVWSRPKIRLGHVT
jgi:hypothetical protein